MDENQVEYMSDYIFLGICNVKVEDVHWKHEKMHFLYA